MDTVCHGKEWDVALVEDNGDIQAALPYLLGHRWGFRYVLQPQLTQYNGPWYRPDDALPPSRQLEREHSLAARLIEHLEALRLHWFQQHFSPSVTNWLPFCWKGYQQSTRYTYRLPDISCPQQVFALFDPGRRQRQILKAERLLHPVEDLTPEGFALFHPRYWQSKGENDLLPQDFIVRVITRSLERRQGLLLGLADDQGTLQIARFVVFDSHSAYSLLSALRPEGHCNGASALLFWTMIQRLSGLTRAFDFEGSMDPGVEQSYRLYGATQTPYFVVSRLRSPLFSLLLKIKQHPAK